MTWTIHTNRDYDPRQRRRSTRQSTGQVYYPKAFREMLDRAEKADTDEHDRDSLMAWQIIVIAVPAAIIIAALIVIR